MDLEEKRESVREIYNEIQTTKENLDIIFSELRENLSKSFSGDIPKENDENSEFNYLPDIPKPRKIKPVIDFVEKNRRLARHYHRKHDDKFLKNPSSDTNYIMHARGKNLLQLIEEKTEALVRAVTAAKPAETKPATDERLIKLGNFKFVKQSKPKLSLSRQELDNFSDSDSDTELNEVQTEKQVFQNHHSNRNQTSSLNVNSALKSNTSLVLRPSRQSKTKNLRISQNKFNLSNSNDQIEVLHLKASKLREQHSRTYSTTSIYSCLNTTKSQPNIESTDDSEICKRDFKPDSILKVSSKSKKQMDSNRSEMKKNKSVQFSEPLTESRIIPCPNNTKTYNLPPICSSNIKLESKILDMRKRNELPEHRISEALPLIKKLQDKFLEEKWEPQQRNFEIYEF